MISPMQALATALAGVPAIANSTGTSVNSTYPDPTVTQIPLPAAWLGYAGSVPLDKPLNGFSGRGVTRKLIYVVMVYLDNTLGQNAFLTTQLPILDEIVAAVRGLLPTPGQAGFAFAFEGERLHSLTTKRVTYEQRFSLITYT